MDIAKVDNVTFSAEDLIIWLKLSGRFSQVVEDFIKEKMAACAARKAGMSASLEELQTSADDNRRALGLHRAVDANEFLDDAGASLDDYEAYLEDQLLADKMRQQVQSATAVEDYFKLNAPRFDAVELSHMVIDDEEQAKEIRSLLAEGEETFADLAREYSTSESAQSGGTVGRVLRGQLPPALEAKLFNAQPGDVVGPIDNSGSGPWEIFQVDSRVNARLEGSTTEMIEKVLYNEWLESKAQELKVQI